jgi:hypothetical protein
MAGGRPHIAETERAAAAEIGITAAAEALEHPEPHAGRHPTRRGALSPRRRIDREALPVPSRRPVAPTFVGCATTMSSMSVRPKTAR